MLVRQPRSCLSFGHHVSLGHTRASDVRVLWIFHDRIAPTLRARAKTAGAGGCHHIGMEPAKNNRRAHFYRLTRVGRRLLEAEKHDWEQTAASTARFFEVKA